MHERAIDVQNRVDIFTDVEASFLDPLAPISYVPHFQVASGCYHQLLLNTISSLCFCHESEVLLPVHSANVERGQFRQ